MGRSKAVYDPKQETTRVFFLNYLVISYFRLKMKKDAISENIHHI